MLLRGEGFSQPKKHSVYECYVCLVIGPMKARRLTYLTALKNYGLIIVYMDIGDFPIIYQGLKYTPPHQVFLDIDNDVCTFNII
jgi:hypothetical protein